MISSPPPGYVLTYSENFTQASSLGAWKIQPNASATFVLSHSYGLGVELTGTEQWGAVANTSAVIGPNSYLTALMYVPPGKGGLVANWPAFWSTGTSWPQNGEIDILEATHGQSCFKAHYGPDAAHEVGSSGCDNDTGWIQIVMWRSNGVVTATHNGVQVASIKLPVSAPESALFQNQDGPVTQCPYCQGPLRYPVTAWLSNLKIWTLKQATKVVPGLVGRSG
jgi:hypothetical protein